MKKLLLGLLKLAAPTLIELAAGKAHEALDKLGKKKDAVPAA